MPQTDDKTAEIMLEHLQQIRKGLGALNLKVDLLEAEMKAGFLGVKNHIAGFSGDTFSYDRRLLNLETALSDLKADLDEHP